MKTTKPKKIAVKVTIHIVIGLLAVFIVLIVIIASSITNDLIEREEEKLTLLATENASIAREFMESMLAQQGVVINTIHNLEGTADAQKIAIMNGIITDTKKSEENALTLFYIAEPNTFIANSPNGYSIFATDMGTTSEADMYKYINKDLYEVAKASKKMMIIDPFDKTIDGNHYMVITVMLPILNERDEVIGVVGSNIDSQLLNNADYNHGGFTSFETQIICGHQTMITNSSNPAVIGKSFVDVSDSINTQKILDNSNNTTPLTFLDTSTNGTKHYKSFVPFYVQGSSVVWLSGTSITKAEFDGKIIKQIAYIAVWLVIALVVLAGLAYYRINKSLRPIKTLEHAVKELSTGNLHHSLDYASNDELGSLADSLRNSTSTLFSYVSDIDRAMSEMANGNFDLEPSQPFIGDFQNIETSIQKFIATISSTLMQIKIASDQVSSGSSQVSDGAQSLAQSATEQASSVEELSAELAEVSAHIKNTAENASSVNQLAVVVGGKINTSNEQMAELITAVSDINQSSGQIGEIIKTIEDIAFQTNILALNAAVEAARAGTAGKGFAVVADEVRNLAIKSSKAAKQTSQLIADSAASVQNGVEIAHLTAGSLSSVVVGANEITALIAEISRASANQTRSVAEITRGVEQISSVVQTNSATSEESAAASEELSGQADMMKLLVSKFRLASGQHTPAKQYERY